MITRWEAWYSEANLDKDPRIQEAPPSQCAAAAAREFLARGKRFVLDLACGIGRDTFCLASHGLSVIGSDAAFNGLRVAERSQTERGMNLALVAADARRLPFRDRSLEGIYCFGLLHEFTGERKEADVSLVMGEIMRLLCTDGILILAVLGGDPQTGLPAVQLFTREMFAHATHGFQAIEIREYDDIGCTGRSDYHVWYGVFARPGTPRR